MLLQLLAITDIIFSLAFIVLCCIIAVRTHTWLTIPIALCALALLLQYLFTVLGLTGWIDNVDLRTYWGRGFYGLFILSVCVLLVVVIRRRI